MNSLRIAFRVLSKAPTFTVVSTLTLALCIGANTAVFSVVDAVLLRPLPYPQPDRLASVVTHFSSSEMSIDQIEQDGRSWQVLHDNARTVDIAAFSAAAGGVNYRVLARLHPGVTWTQANAEVKRIGISTVEAHHYGPSVSASLGLLPLQKGLTSELRVPLLTIWAAVGLVLLIGCVNVAGLLLTRSAGRAREIATRMALGGGRTAIVRQLLAESALLAALGGALGLGLGLFTVPLLKRTALEALGITPEGVHLDWRVLAAALLITAGTAIVFGVYPAVRTVRVDLLSVLAQGGSRSVSPAHASWSRRSLVVFEVALVMIVLTAAGLLLRTFANLISKPPGFDGRGVVTATLSLRDARYTTAGSVLRLYHATLERITRTPGIESAGIGLSLPYSRALNDGFKRLDGLRKDDHFRITDETYVTPGYFETLRMQLLQGRALRWSDTAGAEPVAIVNEAFARMYFKRQRPVGLHLEAAGARRQIVGLIGDVQQSSGWGNFGPVGAAPTIYVPADQVPSSALTLIHTWFTPAWVVRSSNPQQTVIAALQRAVASVDPELPFASFKTMAQVRADAIAFQRVTAALVATLAALALALATIGIYGLIANTVVERTRELGIRMALGATVLQGITAVVAPGVLLSLGGLCLGALASTAATRFLDSLLWDVKPGDPLTLLAVGGLLFVCSLAASLIPGLRVARIDPAVSLRDE